MSKKYDVIFLVDAGIGNAIQMLYAVEYVLHQNLKVGLFLGGVNSSFQEYLKECYPNVVLDSIVEKKTNYLIHGFTYQKNVLPRHNHYFYVKADQFSSMHKSETEQFLEVVKAIYPSDFNSTVLLSLKENYSDRIAEMNIANKIIICPGGSSKNSLKRWPYFDQLIQKLSKEKILVLGSKDDLEYKYSYVYPKYITSLLHQKILNVKRFWTTCKKFGLLIKHAQWSGLKEEEYAYFDYFNWHEMVAIFKRCKEYIGNDGGLTHLAAASGAKGIVLFGPTSVNKNKPLNYNMKPIYKKMSCMPCQFGVEKVQMVRKYINCPYQVKCLNDLKVDEVISNL